MKRCNHTCRHTGTRIGRHGAAAWLLLIGITGFPATSFSGEGGILRELLARARDDVPASTGTPAEAASVPWLERLQMRLSGDDSGSDKRTYAARLYPKTPSQYGAEKEILNLGARRSALSYRIELTQTLADRYRLLADLDLQQRQTHLLQRERDLTRDGIEPMRALAGSDAFRPDRLQSEELRLISTDARLKLNHRRQQKLEARIAAFAGLPRRPAGGIALPTLVPVADLDGLLAGLESGGNPADNTKLEIAQLETEIARQNLRREKGRSGFGLNFMQIGYEQENNADDVYKLTVGVDFPTGYHHTFATAERQQQSNEAEYRMHRLYREQAVQKTQNRAEFALLLTEYHATESQLAELGHRLARQHATTPIALKLELRRERITTEHHQAQLRHDLYYQFIDQLALYGKLAEEPLRNWLLPGQPLL